MSGEGNTHRCAGPRRVGAFTFAATARGDRLAVAQAAPVSANPSDPAFWTGHATRKGGAYLPQTAGIAQHTTCVRFRRRSRWHFRGAPTDAPLARGGSAHGAAAAARVRKGTVVLRRLRGVGSLSGVWGRYAPDAKMEAAQTLVRQAVRSRSREKLAKAWAL